MERSVEDVLGACERAASDTKRGSRERLLLNTVAKSLKSCVTDARSEAASHSTTPERRASAPPAAGGSSPEARPSAAVSSTSNAAQGEGARGSAERGSSAAQPTATSPQKRGTLHQFLTSEEQLSKLAYACRVAMVGEGDSCSGGGLARSSTKALTSALELAAVLLGSGLLPDELETPIPIFEEPQAAPGGATLFFSKLLTGGKRGAAVSPQPQGDGAALPPPPPPPTGSNSSLVNMRSAVVEAVLAAAEVSPVKESNDRLWFVFIATLVSAAVPRLSRAMLQDVSPSAIRVHSLGVHGECLQHVLRFFFRFLARGSPFSPILVEEAKNAIHTVAKCLSKYVEQDDATDAGNSAPAAPADADTAQSVSRDHTPGSKTLGETPVASTVAPPTRSTASTLTRRMTGISDMVGVLDMCSAIARAAPLTPPTVQEGSPSSTSKDGGEFGGGKGGMSNAAAGGPNATSGASLLATLSPQNLGYTALMTSLSLLLHSTINGGPTFRKSPSIIQSIRQNVIPAAVRASVSAELDIFRVSLNVLLTCCLRFGGQVVNETVTVFRHVYFRVLDSSFASNEQKALVIEAFASYIEEPQLLIGLFLNFDCNTHAQSVYEMMIQYLGALARVPVTRASRGLESLLSEMDNSISVHLDYTAPEDLRRRALITLMQVADCNIQWIERFEDDQEEESIGLGSSLRTNGSWAMIHGLGTSAGHDTEMGASVSGGDAFLQARRYKDAFRKFLDLFNVKADPRGAMQYLSSSILTLDEEDGDVSNSQATPVTDGAEEIVAPNAADGPSKEGAPAGDGAEPAGPNVAATLEKHGADSTDEEAAERESAHRVAAFLKENEDFLDKTVLGDYFAKAFRSNQSRSIFEEWIRLHDFSDMTVDEALRLFLGGFKLLGEAQVVDKTMELFASQYCHQNPGIFGSADTAFILSFSMCMLNTDAHSQHVKNKMTKDGFINNNRGINEGHDVDPAILGGIYDRITQNEIVLRPSSKCRSRSSASASTAAGGNEKSRGTKIATNVLDSIPILRHLTPLAAAITDKVLLPMDAAGNALFNLSQKRRDEKYQEELRNTLKEVMEALQAASTSDVSHHSMFVTATSIENALPMWEVTVDIMCGLLVSTLVNLLEASEQYVRPNSGSAMGEKGVNGAETRDGVAAYMEDTHSEEFFKRLLTGFSKTVQVCCSFGNVSHTERLLEQLYDLTTLRGTVEITNIPSTQVTIQGNIPTTRLALLSLLLDTFMQYGAALDARSWKVGYEALSLLDAMVNGVEGMWHRKSGEVPPSPPQNQSTQANGMSAAQSKKDQKTSQSRKKVEEKGSGGGPAIVDGWFGDLSKAPKSIAGPTSLAFRRSILANLRTVSKHSVDAWLERLFNITEYPPLVQIQMTNGLVKVCQSELPYRRSFSLMKVFDFVTFCASFASRMQWRDLWAHASSVFIMAGRMADMQLAESALNGLRLIALNYLMREELLNYSFQKEVLKPFEEILMSNQSVVCRQRVMSILAELIEIRAEHLASGWNVVFSCLSHAAAIPDVAPDAWRICEQVMEQHLPHVKDCFSDLVFCLTTFACSNVQEEIPLRAVSYLVCCGHWLQYGLESPPKEVADADSVARWATRFPSAEQEAEAALSLGRHLVRVTLSPEPLTRSAALQKPTTFTAKTIYHLWMSLFEGLVPIVVVHSSVRVRAHAMASLWSLLQQYGSVFSSEVQDSVFGSMVRPVLTTLVTHVPSSGIAGGGGNAAGATDAAPFDTADYRLLVNFALKGMILACSADVHLLKLACDTITSLGSTTKFTLEMIHHDFIDAVVRVCCDFSAAVPFGLVCDGSVGESGVVSMASIVKPATGIDEAPYGPETLYALLSAEAREENAIIPGLLHELQQIGVVDVVRYKRTAGWTELHNATVAQSSLIFIPATFARSATLVQLVRQSILDCLSNVLVTQLTRLLCTHMQDREVSLELVSQLRHVYLGIAYHYLVTRDTKALLFLKQRIDTPIPEECYPPSALQTKRKFFPAVELLILVPYTFVLLEFISSFVQSSPSALALLAEGLSGQVTEQLVELERSRQACISAQEVVYAAIRDTVTKSKDGRFKPHKGRLFTDVFRAGRYSIALRAKYITGQTDAAIQDRIENEYSFLLRLLGLRYLLSMGRRSTLLSSCGQPFLLRLLRIAPSALEEQGVEPFMESAWQAMDLHCGMGGDAVVASCVGLLGG